MGTNGRITDTYEYGEHITLKCRNHLDKRWSTKNISPIGCRTIYYNLMGDSAGNECDCSLGDLTPLEPNDEATN